MEIHSPGRTVIPRSKNVSGSDSRQHRACFAANEIRSASRSSLRSVSRHLRPRPSARRTAFGAAAIRIRQPDRGAPRANRTYHACSLGPSKPSNASCGQPHLPRWYGNDYGIESCGAVSGSASTDNTIEATYAQVRVFHDAPRSPHIRETQFAHLLSEPCRSSTCRLSDVLLVGDVFQPLDDLAVEHLGKASATSVVARLPRHRFRPGPIRRSARGRINRPPSRARVQPAATFASDVSAPSGSGTIKAATGAFTGRRGRETTATATNQLRRNSTTV